MRRRRIGKVAENYSGGERPAPARRGEAATGVRLYEESIWRTPPRQIPAAWRGRHGAKGRGVRPARSNRRRGFAVGLAGAECWRRRAPRGRRGSESRPVICGVVDLWTPDSPNACCALACRRAAKRRFPAWAHYRERTHYPLFGAQSLL